MRTFHRSHRETRLQKVRILFFFHFHSDLCFSVEWEYRPDYRSCKRLVTKSFDTCEVMWKRLIAFMVHDDLVDVRPFGFDNSGEAIKLSTWLEYLRCIAGVWQPSGVNECLRFTRYDENDHFSRHRDGGFVRDDENRSVYTGFAYSRPRVVAECSSYGLSQRLQQWRIDVLLRQSKR
jgi:hypothetical protein